jgi:predicted amidohydrolase YtcJ
MTKIFPKCICCNPLFNEFVTQLTRRQFLLGTGAFTAAVLTGNRGNKSVQAQTEGIRILGDDQESIEELNSNIIIYVAKKVITMEKEQPSAKAVGVLGDRILAVGSLEAVKTAMGNRSYTVDRTFEDKYILPGFVEHHLHPLLGSLTMALEIISIEDWTVPGKFSAAVQNEADYKARLKKSLAKMKDNDANDTLFTWGYHHYFHGKIYRSQLDEISPNRPIVTWHRSCHEFILNTAALEKYGVTEEALQGHGLSSEQASWKDGHFYEKGMEIIIPFIAKDILAPERSQEGLRIFKSYLLSKGITTICEPGTQMVRNLQQFWENSLDKDDTSFRTYFIPDGRALYDRNKKKQTLDNLVADTESYLKWGKGKVQWLPKQVKLFADGAIFSQLMQVEQPYLDGHQGEWIAVPEDYTAAFKIYWDAGYQISTHVNGDRGLQLVTDVFEERFKANPRQNHRFTVVHFAVSTGEQVKRLGQMNAIITANPYYVTSLADRYSEFGLGAERADTMVRLGSVAKTDMAIALHSDMPMAPADPLFLAWCAVNRTTVSGRTAAPEQRISVEQALRGVTIDSAYCIQQENEIGSIKAGKKADFTILEQDPFTVSVAQLKDIPVWGCVFEGEIFESPKEIAKVNEGIKSNFVPDTSDFTEIAQTRG